MTLKKNAYLYLVLTDMIFRQVHGSALFLHIYIVGKVLLLLHGNLQILFVKQKQCWPPLTASQMRTNTLIWYIKNVIPAMQMLSDDPKTDSSLRLLEDSLALLTKFENNLFSGGGGGILCGAI
ncbi:hypothetical protein ACLBR5_32870 [Escherichia coli]